MNRTRLDCGTCPDLQVTNLVAFPGMASSQGMEAPKEAGGSSGPLAELAPAGAAARSRCRQRAPMGFKPQFRSPAPIKRALSDPRGSI